MNIQKQIFTTNVQSRLDVDEGGGAKLGNKNFR